MGRAPCCDKTKVKRGPWSPEEDTKLRDYIERYGNGGNWISLPHKAGLKRCGKSCRLRWLNYLRPNIKHGDFSEEEDRIICSLFAAIGSRWSIIAAHLPGRTDNDIKNHWNTKLRKKLLASSSSSSSSAMASSPQNPNSHNMKSPLNPSTIPAYHHHDHHHQYDENPNQNTTRSLTSNGFEQFLPINPSNPPNLMNNSISHLDSFLMNHPQPMSYNHMFHQNHIKDNNNNNNSFMIMSSEQSCSSSDGGSHGRSSDQITKPEEISLGTLTGLVGHMTTSLYDEEHDQKAKGYFGDFAEFEQGYYFGLGDLKQMISTTTNYNMNSTSSSSSLSNVAENKGSALEEKGVPYFYY